MENMGQSNYKKMLLMLIISFIIMYAVMFLNVDKLNHIYFSYTRTYMSLLMVTPMALLMLLLMPAMYPDKKTNKIISVSAIVVFVFALTALRSQAFISDAQYMKAMIPHHSSAILTSKNANIRDPEVRQLSDSIIKSQEEEISQMKLILKRMK
ncbi:protein of unknown function [Flavobacterium flevense]|uniref:DUF305 domain-containing protein n=2 Tax=Flavobacterium flevense TaxID=983 RepID=A0A4Y4B510_9FLAO|nr:DUF305 domain-containing protein [Flavobacterium flevense]GEC73733.1 hypothetical protein FFL01_32720 [Flavobacterium flevense]SHL61277.1 protein of unknown function [Flavobacterium flevense]